VSLKRSIEVLCEAIVKDGDYRMSWKANIAMAFKDEYARVYGDQELMGTVHDIANSAADNFLTMLTRNVNADNEEES
jgi:hypothetical protein